jgi:hypothetical protein
VGPVEAVVVFAVGYVGWTATRWFAGPAAVVGLLLAVLGLAAPASPTVRFDPVLSFHAGNDMLFSGFLFAIAHRSGATDRRRWRRSGWAVAGSRGSLGPL